MKTVIEKRTYCSFDELPPERQEEVFKEYQKKYEIYDDWHDLVTEDWMSKMTESGFDVKYQTLEFDIYHKNLSFKLMMVTAGDIDTIFAENTTPYQLAKEYLKEDRIIVPTQDYNGNDIEWDYETPSLTQLEMEHPLETAAGQNPEQVGEFLANALTLKLQTLHHELLKGLTDMYEEMYSDDYIRQSLRDRDDEYLVKSESYDITEVQQ